MDLRNDIRMKETKEFSHILQRFCDNDIVAHSVGEAMFDLQAFGEEKKISHLHGKYCKTVFKGDVEQSIVLAEAVGNLKKNLESLLQDVHSSDVAVKKYSLNVKFGSKNSLNVSLRVTGVSRKNCKAVYSNKYAIGFNRNGDVDVVQRDRYDMLGRRLKCRG